jgi:endonuclease-3
MVLPGEEVNLILDKLEEMYPDAGCELDYRTPFQLLIAVVLSAQTTDKKVNEVTEHLFLRYPNLDEMMTLSEKELQDIIKKIGLYRNKAKHITGLCRMIKEHYEGNVPNTFEELVGLPGVGRKTANVLLSNAFNIPAIAVDTHVFRVSNRIGLADANNVLDTEKQLMDAIPREKWIQTHHMLIWHGRRVCFARHPNCSNCELKEYCQYSRKLIE